VEVLLHSFASLALYLLTRLDAGSMSLHGKLRFRQTYLFFDQGHDRKVEQSEVEGDADAK
jgi:hypothetical protein